MVSGDYDRLNAFNGALPATLTAVRVPKRARISTTFGTHVWPVHTPRSFLLFLRTQKGRGKMAAKRQVPMGQKNSKFVVGKRKSVDVWRSSRPPKKCLGAKPVLQRGVAKWLPKCRVAHSS